MRVSLAAAPTAVVSQLSCRASPAPEVFRPLALHQGLFLRRVSLLNCLLEKVVLELPCDGKKTFNMVVGAFNARAWRQDGQIKFKASLWCILIY